MSYEYTGGYKFRDQGGLHYVTFNIEGWIDLFSRRIYQDIFLESMQYCPAHKALKVGAYIIMPSYIHLILQSGTENLIGTIRDMKSYCSKKIMTTIKPSRKAGGTGCGTCLIFMPTAPTKTMNLKYGRMITSRKLLPVKTFLLTKLNYIHENPVRAGFVLKPENWVYSSASDYVMGKGMSGIDF